MCSFQSVTLFHLLKRIYYYTIQDFYPNIEVTFRIFLTIPVTTTTYERNFSKLKIIKNDLRSTMNPSHLTSMDILSIEKSLVHQLIFDDILEYFTAIKAQFMCNDYNI